MPYMLSICPVVILGNISVGIFRLWARSPGQKFGVCKYNTPEKKFIGSFQNKTPDNFLKMEHLQNSRSISDKTTGGF